MRSIEWLRQRRKLVVFVALISGIGVALGWGRRIEPELVTVIDELPGRGAMLEERARLAASGPDAEVTLPVRGEMTASDAAVLFPTIRRGSDVFDPSVYFRRPASTEVDVWAPEHPARSWTIVTNSLGLRQDWEISATPVDLRVLVIGDSQTAGVCPAPESVPGLLHSGLGAEFADRSVEVINGGKGAWTFHNYLGLLDRLAEIEIDVAVIVAYGGNDFSEGLLLHHYFARTAPERHEPAYYARVRSASESTSPAVAHTLYQAHYFADVPDAEALALDSAREVTAAILAGCRERGVRPIFALIPSPVVAQPDVYREQIDALVEALELTPAELAVEERLSDAWLAFLEQQGAETVDLREDLTGHEPLYWERNHHLNSTANRRVAARLQPLLARHLLDADRR